MFYKLYFLFLILKICIHTHESGFCWKPVKILEVNIVTILLKAFIGDEYILYFE